MMKRCFVGSLVFAAGLALGAPAGLDPGTTTRLKMAKEQVERNPAQPDGHISMALAAVKAARAADRPAYLEEAEKAVAEALKLAPDSFDAHKARVVVRLAQGQDREALEEAVSLNKKVPDDNQMYGYIADADMALGDYAGAEKAIQWMIDQRPVNAPGLQRGALLREILGYNEPALEWWNSALRITSSSDLEERAWILVNMSRVDLRAGKPADAEKHARQALGLVPQYPWALDALAASLRLLEKPAEAAEVLQQRLSGASHPQAMFHLAAALDAAGRADQAAAMYQQFEKEASGCVTKARNANLELIEYYSSHARIERAVELASQENARHPNVPTLAAYAAALAAAGKYDEARTQMDRALAPGIRDAKLFYQAGMIAAKLSDVKSAEKYLKKTIEINASSPEAGKAIQLLAHLS